jgi:hypothetical protein
MTTHEIERCADCTGGECDKAYVRAAIEIMFLDPNTPEEIIKDKEHLLDLRVREIAKCTLSLVDVQTNLHGLIRGNLELNGREEIPTRQS